MFVGHYKYVQNTQMYNDKIMLFLKPNHRKCLITFWDHKDISTIPLAKFCCYLFINKWPLFRSFRLTKLYIIIQIGKADAVKQMIK